MTELEVALRAENLELHARLAEIEKRLLTSATPDVSEQIPGGADDLRQAWATLEANNEAVQQARKAALNLMQDAVAARTRSEEGNVLLQAEIAERQRAEDRLKLGIQVAGLALAEIDYHTGLNHLQEETARLFGLGETAMVVPREVVHATFHPDDREALKSRIAHCLDPAGPGWFAMEHRVVLPNGKVRWLRVRKQVFFTGEGALRRPRRAMLAALDVTAEKAAAESLRQSEAFKRAVLDAVSSHVAVLDRDGTIIAVNAPWDRFTRDNSPVSGQPASNTSVGSNYLEVCRTAMGDSAEDALSAYEGIREVLVGNLDSFSLDYPCHTREQQRWYTLNVTPMQGGSGGVVVSHTDISTTRRMAEELRISEERFRMALRNSPVSVAVQDRELRYLWAYNQRTAKPDEIVGHFDADIFTPEEAAHFTAIKRRVLDEGVEINVQRWVQRPSGPIYLDIYWEPIRDQTGLVTGVGSATVNLTPLKLAEMALRDNEERTRLALEVSHTFAFEWDPASDRVLRSDTCSDIIGLPLESACFDTGRDFFQRVHPDDRARFTAQLEALKPGADSYRCEYRLLHDDGREVHLLESARALFDAEGKLQRLVGATTDITERKAMEQAMRENEERYRLIVENTSEGIWLEDTDGRTTFVNPAMARILGYTPAEMLGTCLEHYIPPEDRGEYQRQRRLLQEVRVTHYQRRLQRKDGRLCWCQVSAAPLINAQKRCIGTVSLKTDITDTRLAAKALRESEARFRTLFESSGDALMLLDVNGFLDCNEATLRMLGCTSRADFIGKHPAQFSPATQPDGANSRASADAFISVAFREGSARYEWRHCRLDGSEFSAEVMLKRVLLLDKPLLQATVRDISERLAILDDLARAKEAAEQANQAKSMFLANMSHEIRTPMNAIVGMTELCLGTHPNERQRNYLGKIRLASDALLHIIDDILDFSKVEAGKLDMEEEPFTLADVCDRMTSLLTARAHDKGVELKVAIDAGLDRQPFLGDARRLGQILVNLVGNAIKFSKAGAVTVSVDQENPGINGTPVGDTATLAALHFSVRDEGIGIALDEQARLFQPFSQADASTTRLYGGTGLGLAISQRLVALMGGRIWVDSTPGRGSTFHFTIHLAPSDRAPTHPPRIMARMDSMTLERLRGADILLVEDAELNQDVMRGILEQAGARVRLAVNGEEALRQVAEALPDCVLMDCQMPVMDGYEATRQLRTRPDCRDLPIIALTANTMAGDRERCLAAGMNGFLAKPVNFDALYLALLKWLRPRRPDTLSSSPEFAAVFPMDAPALPDLPGIDSHRGIALTGGSPDFFVSLLEKFRDYQASDFLCQFHASRDAGDWTTATRFAHTLKSTARTLGASKLGECAARLEEACRLADPEASATSQAAMEEELDRVICGLARLNKQQAAPISIGPLPRALLQSLTRQLEDHDTAAVDTLAALEQALGHGPNQARMTNLKRAISRYDFAAARVHLQQLAYIEDESGEMNM